MSLRDALQQLLGGPCYHMEAVLRTPSHIAAWHAAARGEPVDWASLLHGYVAGVDWPVAAHYGSLLTHFPAARVVLTHRDPEAWYRSTRETIYAFSEALNRRPERWLLAAAGGWSGFQAMVDATIWNGTFDGRFLDRDHALRVYEAHVARVRSEVPAEQLVVFEVSDGWEPLCRFLDLPVPTTPFPRTNDRASMQRRLLALRALAWGAAPMTASLAQIRRLAR